MKKALSIILATVACFSLSAQRTIKSEDIGSFTAVSLSGNLQSKLVKADKNAIDIELPEADAKYLKCSVVNGTLVVSFRSGMMGNKTMANVTVKYAEPLKSISVSSGELTLTDPLTSKLLEISVTAGGTFVGQVQADDLELSVSGNSAAKLDGSVKYLILRATEKSKVDTREMSTTSAEVETGTGAEAYVTVSDRIVANAKSSSTIFYKGKPSIVKDRSSKMSTTIGSSVLSID